VAKLPQLRRSEPETTPEDGAGRVERTDPGPAGRPEPSPRTGRRERSRWARRARRADPADQSPAYSRKVEQAAERAAEATRSAAAAAAAERAHARARTSILASASLVLAVVAALAVATGTLAQLGVAIGVLGLLVGLAALAATVRRHRFLAGRTEATVAVLLSLAAIVIGGLAVAGSLSWLDTDADHVQQLRDWLPGWLS
jgi:hypothetical protein